MKELQSLFNAFLADGESKRLRQALDDYQQKTEYPGVEFFSLAATFFTMRNDFKSLCGVLDRWKKCKGEPIEPYQIYCDLGFEKIVPKAVYKANLEELLRRTPTDPSPLLLAYCLARQDSKDARRLFYALQLSKIDPTVGNLVRYGIECGRLSMPEFSQEAFEKALKIEPKSTAATNGLGMCYFERMELGKAEEQFRAVLRIAPDDECSKTMLARIAKLKSGEPWVKYVEARRKFYVQWQESQLTILTPEKRSRMMADVAARKPKIKVVAAKKKRNR
jgi:tetratricopeptide (TPR) repeat protein